MANIRTSPKLTEIHRDKAGHPKAIADVMALPERPFTLSTDGCTFNAQWPVGHFDAAPARDQLATMLAVQVPPLLDRVHGVGIAAAPAAWAATVAHAVLVKLDGDTEGFQRATELLLPADTPLSLANRLHASIDATIAAALQHGACVAIAAMLGHVSKLGTAPAAESPAVPDAE